MSIKLIQIKTVTMVLIAVLAIIFTIMLPIATLMNTLFLSIDHSDSHNLLINAMEDYTKSTIIFVILIWLFCYLYKSYLFYINRFLKQHFLLIKGFGILYVTILAIVPVLKDSLNAYVKLSPYHHILIYLVVIIVFFCVFISSFEEDVMSKQFKFTEMIVCFLLCLLGLGLFFMLMDSPQ